MIILDIETSGLDFMKNGICSIGALCFDNVNEKFYEECKIDDEDDISKGAMKINRFTEEDFRDKTKQTQEELIEKFFDWLEKQEDKMLAGHNIGFFDLNFLKKKAEKYGIQIKSRYRSLDLCSVAQFRYFQVYSKFLLDDYKENSMNLSEILKFCGMKDERIKLDKDDIIKEGKPHNALEDAELEAECFFRLMNGKPLFEEYAKFSVPEYLKKGGGNDNL